MTDQERADRTSRMLDRAFRRMLEADARIGLEGMREGVTPGEDLAYQVGIRTLKTVCEAWGLDTGVLLTSALERAGLQTEAMLAALRIELEGNWLELVTGATAGGVMTGVRIGLMLAELDAQEKQPTEKPTER